MKKEEEKLLMYGLGFIAAYILIIKPILVKIGLLEDEARLKTEERKKTQIQTQIDESAKTQKQTKTDQEFQVIADQIYEDLRYSAISDNKSDAAYQVARVKNDTDLWILYKYFAKRREYLFGLPSGSLQDLSQFINSNLSTSVINQINKNYQSKNIKFRF